MTLVESATATLERFQLMAVMRAFEEVCRSGFESGDIHGELHSSIGMEAIAAGMAESLRIEDAVVSTHRCHLHAIAKQVPLRPLLAEVFERESGLCRGRGGHMHLFDSRRNFSTTGIVGASLPVALGYAYASWLDDRSAVAVGITGDGGANHGTFHECLNIAGAWRLPFVLLAENNYYAISVPFESVSATETIAERGAAYGAWHERVDGTDVDAVADRFRAAVEHARRGDGPALLEATAYRFAGHYEGDHDMYRSDTYRDEMYKHDPLDITAARLREAGIDQSDLDKIVANSRQEMLALLEDVKSDPLPAASGATDHVYVGLQR